MDEPPAVSAKRFPVQRVLRWIAGTVLALLLLLVAAAAYLHTPPGRQFIVDQIAAVAPASGLKVEVGSIEGSVLYSATFHDVKLRDANDVLFLEVPTVDLGWRPWRWLWSGLDVRYLALTGGTLHAIPELTENDPDAPILPDFDIRIDSFIIDDLTVAKGIAGDERLIDFTARADVEDGLVLLDAKGELGGGDVISALIHAEPDGNVFDLDVDWRAPAGGVLAAMVGAEEDMAIRLTGEGTWEAWGGKLAAEQGGAVVLEIDLANRSGEYRAVGLARPGDNIEGLPARALGDLVRFSASGTLVDSMLGGDFLIRARGFTASGTGEVDLANNAFSGVTLAADLLDPALFSPDITLTGAQVEATLDGPFRDLALVHVLTVREVDAGGTILTNVRQEGTLAWDGSRATLPLGASVARVVSGNALFDPRLVGGRVTGTLAYAGDELTSDALAVRFPGLEADLALTSNFASRRTQLTGPVELADLAVDNIGTLDATARIDVTLGGGTPWRLAAVLDGRMGRVTNETITSLAGTGIRFRGGLALGGAQPLLFQNLAITGSKLTAQINGSADQGTTTLAGNGTQAEYGAFTVEASLADDGPRAVLVFASPLPAAGLKDVRVALSPTENGFAIETSGGSLLGPFDGLIDLAMPENGPARIGIARLDVAETSVTGDLALGDGGVDGNLLVNRGGVEGTIALAARGGGQGFEVDLAASNARFGGATPLTIARGRIDASGLVVSGNTTLQGSASLQGVSYGSLFLGRAAARAQVANGIGHVDAAVAGRRGSRFELLLSSDITPERITLAADGNYGNRAITMVRRAVLLAEDGGGWRLEPTQLSYGRGFLLAEGRFGGGRPIELQLGLADLPLDMAGAVMGDLGMGGRISGRVSYTGGAGGLPVGEARVMVDNLTRSSALLTSEPLDIAFVGRMSESLLQARAVMSDPAGASGRVQMRISGLPRMGDIAERLYEGDLAAQLRYSGPAGSLWRLAAIDLIDISGDAAVAANITGSLGNPRVTGSLAGDALRLRSGVTGTDISALRMRGRFTGSRLNLTSFSGTANGGGTVSGSGYIDLADMNADRGPRIDLRIAARGARILDLDNMGATVTGPLRIVSSGVGGTIAGRLDVRRANWTLGQSEVLAELPNVAIREINVPADRAPVRAAQSPWRYLIDASAASGIDVDGMGLDSEWRGAIRLRGTTADPRIGGAVDVVPRRGFYDFAGSRFELTRGRIDFDEAVALDPRVNIIAQSDTNGLAVTVNVTGSASQPDISFSSTPALPEEELLARLLFGDSVTSLSATDALQLGAAVASLRSGAGVGPINQLRNAIGLDRLRIVAADPVLGRSTAIALGKNISRRFYAEIVTDGAGYNASELEYRLTSWLSLLGTVSTLGRHSVAAEVRRDY